MTIDSSRRNVFILALCQALAMMGTTIMIAAAALVGHMLVTDKSLATLPLAVQQLAVMLTTFPASYLMKKVGRGPGFRLGAVFGFAGAALAVYAIVQASFVLFCVAAGLSGVYSGFALFYRFAAADSAAPEAKARAISYVLAGGVIAAVAGPELAKWSKDWMAPVSFAGSFAALSVLALLSLCLLSLIRIPAPTMAERTEKGRPLIAIMRQPSFFVAALGSLVGFGGMALVMTATPLAMAACLFPFESAAFVIQWHALAMFAPSFVTGHLVARFGIFTTMIWGVALTAAAVAVNLSGVEFLHFWVALILLGLGWNLLSVASTTLLTESYTPAERAKTQAANEFLSFGAVAVAAFTSGALLEGVGWAWLNLAVLPMLVVVLVAIVWLSLRRRAVPA